MNKLAADSFRYGILVGLRYHGCTEKVAYEILDALETQGYDLEKTAAWGKAMGGAASVLNKAKGLFSGAAKAAPKMNPYTGVAEAGAAAAAPAAAGAAGKPGMLRKGLDWLQKNPKTFAAGAAGAGYMYGGSRGRAAGKEEGFRASQDDFMKQLPQMRAQDMAGLMQLMSRQGQGGLPSWYSPEAIYGR